MCSINEDTIVSGEEISAVPIVAKQSFKDAQCRRCQEVKAQVLLRKTDPYCSKCFMSYAIHKFRSTLGKFKAVRPNELVLLACSGGLSSGSMLKLVQQGLEEAWAQKRMIFKPSVLYIDEGALLNLSAEERLQNAQFVREQATSCQLKFHATTLEYCLASNPEDVKVYIDDYTVDPSPYDNQFQDLFSSVSNLTAKEDLLLRMKQNLITSVAKKLQHKKVFLGATGSRTASQLLAAVAQGRGAQIADEIGFSDARTGVEFLRPMREFVDKEVAYLARFLDVDSLSVPTLASKLRANASINRLTEEFVVKLQTDFPGTISTLFRTGDKLKSTSVGSVTNGAEDDVTCVICHSKIEETPLCSAYSARTFSQTVSRTGPHRAENALAVLDSDRKSCLSGCGDSSSCESNSKLTSCCKQSHALPPKEDWENTLCYGCRVTIQDVGKPQCLSQGVQDEIIQRVRRQKMRESVEQFLL